MAPEPRLVSGQPPAGGSAKPAPAVLADRVTASLLDHDPGRRPWTPRRSDPARKHHVTAAEIDAAIRRLAGPLTVSTWASLVLFAAATSSSDSART